MVKIWKVSIRLCNVLTLYLCTLFHVILARNYMCSLMMISDMLSKQVGAVKKCFKKVI